MTQTNATAADIARYRANLKDEVDGAALYRLLAEFFRQDPAKHQ